MSPPVFKTGAPGNPRRAGSIPVRLRRGRPLRRTRLARALVRIEGELIDQDAADGDPDVRTTSERRADAFALLAERLTATLDRPEV